MTATSCHSRKLAPILVFLITFLLILSLSLPWVSAEEEKKPTAKEWQINGIFAALDEGYDEIKEYAFDELKKYETKEIKKPEKAINKIAHILTDEDVKSDVRGSAAEALANFGQPAAKYIPDIVNILKDEKVDSYLRSSAAEALAKFGQPAAKYIPDIVNILKDEKVHFIVRYGAAEALAKFGKQLKLEQVVVILNNLYYASYSESKRWRFLTYFTGGGSKEVKTLLTWLGYPHPRTIPQQLNYDEAKKTLQVFLKVWQPTEQLGRVRKDLADKIATVANNKNVTWRLQDISLLQKHYDNLKAAGYNDADTLRYVINNLEFWKWFFLAKNIFVIHLVTRLSLVTSL